MVRQAWDLAAACCRFGKDLEVEVNGSVPPVSEVLRDLLSRTIATEHGELPQGLTVLLRVERAQASAELDLGEAARSYPPCTGLHTDGSQGSIASVGFTANISKAPPAVEGRVRQADLAQESSPSPADLPDRDRAGTR
jgi:hypothetical protein